MIRNLHFEFIFFIGFKAVVDVTITAAAEAAAEAAAAEATVQVINFKFEKRLPNQIHIHQNNSKQICSIHFFRSRTRQT